MNWNKEQELIKKMEPCPLCGGNTTPLIKEKESIGWFESAMRGSVFVMAGCVSCNAYVFADFFDDDDLSSVVDAWNKRDTK